MKHQIMLIISVMAVCVALAGTAVAQPNQPEAPAAAITTKFTYQGQLKRDGALFNGTCDMQFNLWDADNGGAQLATYTPPAQVNVTDGVFAVELDFGAQFKGEARWLETATKCADDADFTTLPRVALTPTPYALGLMPGAQIEGSINGSAGILRASNDGAGAALVGLANSTTGTTYGVLGNAFSPNGYAIWGYASNNATALRGFAADGGRGVWGSSLTWQGVFGESRDNVGVVGTSTNFNGVWGDTEADNAIGVVGWGKDPCPSGSPATCYVTHVRNASGVAGHALAGGYGVWGQSATGVSVAGFAPGYDRPDVDAYSLSTPAAMFGGVNGVIGFTKSTGNGVSGVATTAGGTGVYGYGADNTIAVAGTRNGYSTNDLNGYGFAKPAAMFGGPNGAIGFSKTDGGNGLSGVATTAGGVGIAGYNFAGGYAGYFYGKASTTSLEIRGGSDLAEWFDVGTDKVEPGTLMVIDPDNPGHLTLSRSAYDTKVAGVVSGAGDVKPGLTLQQEGILDGDTQVAIAGRVYVKATADNGAIEPGDLLTTSDRPGSAMKATDRNRSSGAIIGKAMTSLDKGEGLVLVLVNLQ